MLSLRFKDNVNFTITETHLEYIDQNGYTYYFVHPPNRQFYSCFTRGKKAVIHFPNIIEQFRHDGLFLNHNSWQLVMIFYCSIPYNNLLVLLTNAGYSLAELKITRSLYLNFPKTFKSSLWSSFCISCTC
uniref:Maturase K n=1 Tax=Panagrolaimus sp. JU765 TaxID=591449 RepID=A0AC34QBW5_9BILA